MKINSILHQMIKGKTLWIGLIMLSLSMLGVAWFYQYFMDEPPCVLCIHFRLLFVVIIIVSLIGLLTRHYKLGNILSSFGVLASFAFMTERAYQTLGTERRFITSECTFGLNFPDWIAVDKWFPSFFQPMTSCGYTPEILFGITMAEALMVFTVVMTLFSLRVFILSFSRKTKV
ncbi:MAG: disulfide bond formation protein B [Cocleimonas sp.]|nr:disulfide bond formation protein B [Cocleimonas sp.]